MKRLAHGFRDGVKLFLRSVREENERLFRPSMESLRETNWFCVRFFVSLQVTFFYFWFVLSNAIDFLPHSPRVYTLMCGAGGAVVAVVLRQTWVLGKRRS